MSLKDFLDGVAIIQAFYDEPGGYHIGAEHDQIYLYATDVPIDADSVAKLRELGWFQPDVEDGPDGVPAYDPSTGWSTFV